MIDDNNIRNEYKFRFTVKQSPQNGLWLITVEGVTVGTWETEEGAWKFVHDRWAPYPEDSVRETIEQIEMQLHSLNTVMSDRWKKDAYYQYARTFQRISELANAGLRISLLARGHEK